MELTLKYNDFYSWTWCHSAQPTFEQIEENLISKISELIELEEKDGLRRSEAGFLSQLQSDLKIVKTESKFTFKFDFRSHDGEFESNYGMYVVEDKKVSTHILYNYD